MPLRRIKPKDNEGRLGTPNWNLRPDGIGLERKIHLKPDPAIIVYDGNCRFCIRQMRWIQARDSRQVFEFVPSNSDGLFDRFPCLREQNLNSGLRVILSPDEVAAGSDAVHAIARRLPRWRYLAWIYNIPGTKPLWQAAYAWIAARRYRWAQRCDDSCSAPENSAAKASGQSQP